MAQVESTKGKLHTVKVGDSIGFKDDCENYGKVERIEGAWITLSVCDGVTGEWESIQQHASRCWYEG